MRLLLAALALVALVTSAAPAFAQYVSPYFRRDGGYVQPHIRSAPDGNPYNNFGTYRRNNFAAPPSSTLPTFPTFPYSH